LQPMNKFIIFTGFGTCTCHDTEPALRKAKP
jgi:hypothetical protein